MSESLGTKLHWVLPGCIIGLAENLIGIATLGYYVPTWQLRWVTFSLYRRSRKMSNKMLELGKGKT